MALPPAPSINAFHAVATAVPAVALIVTAIRLYYRINRKLAWWDDLLVAIASFFMVVLVIFIWLSSTAGLPQKLKVASYYLCTFTFTLSNYFARLSILVGILRIAPNPRTRTVLKGMAGLFVLIMCVLMAQKVWICDGSTKMAKTWKTLADPECRLGMQVAITELVTDIICDAMLVITPLTFLSRSKLKPAQKRRLYAIFGASIATTITSIVQDYLILVAGGLREETGSMMEVSVAIIVANLPVIISWIYRLRNQKADDNATRFATDYDHNRRAKPSAWANSSDLVSDSNNATSKHHQLTSQSRGHGIQLSDVRRTPGEDVLDLRTSRKVEDDGLSYDGSSVKKTDLEYDSAFDGTAKGRGRDAAVDFAVSAISYGGGNGRRVDAEYDIDIVDDLDQHSPLPQLTHKHSRSIVDEEKDSSLAYTPYAYPPDSRPFASAATPTSSTAPAYDSPHSHRDSYPGSGSYANFPPPALAHGLTSRSSPVSPLNYTSPSSPLPVAVPGPTISSALRRNGSNAGRLAHRFSEEEQQRRPAEGTKTKSRSRSPPETPSVQVTSATQSRNPSARAVGMFNGIFGSGNGVLVEQQVTVTADPEDLAKSQRR